MLHSWSYYPSTLSCSLCLRLEKNKYTFGSIGVFHQQGPCTWSLPCLYEQVHFERNLKEFYNSEIPPSEELESTSTNTLSRMLPMPHLELLDKRRTWVTPYQEVQMSRPTLLGILNANRKIRKCTDTDVALTREYSRVSIFHRERECTNSRSPKDNYIIIFCGKRGSFLRVL